MSRPTPYCWIVEYDYLSLGGWVSVRDTFDTREEARKRAKRERLLSRNITGPFPLYRGDT